MRFTFLFLLRFQTFLSYAASDHPVYLLCDGQCLVHEPVGQLGELLLGQREDEVVAAVAAEGERAVVLAESYPPSADFVLRVRKICVSLQSENEMTNNDTPPFTITDAKGGHWEIIQK